MAACLIYKLNGICGFIELYLVAEFISGCGPETLVVPFNSANPVGGSACCLVINGSIGIKLAILPAWSNYIGPC